eukprot:CAMPEP_0116912938 /NCGR_PEP_ID=MMETSP0467-20121206/16397_1 /TAXON_ID=283647 /ORGANISM="Mesodinium pulex, Strain SPMC105" /LENGTH=55 /DNA_ID=CAMNT_0004589039 /DNA_START=186 /DNA_END=353 /DNA_ORIENTATION=+
MEQVSNSLDVSQGSKDIFADFHQKIAAYLDQMHLETVQFVEESKTKIEDLNMVKL